MFRNYEQRAEVTRLLLLRLFKPELWNSEKNEPSDLLFAMGESPDLRAMTGAEWGLAAFALWIFTNEEAPLFSDFNRWDRSKQRAIGSLLVALAGEDGDFSGLPVDQWCELQRAELADLARPFAVPTRRTETR